MRIRKRDWNLHVGRDYAQVNEVCGDSADPVEVKIFESTFDQSDKRDVVGDALLIAHAPRLLKAAIGLVKKLQSLDMDKRIGIVGEVNHLRQAVDHATGNYPFPEGD